MVHKKKKKFCFVFVSTVDDYIWLVDTNRVVHIFKTEDDHFDWCVWKLLGG